MGAFRDTGANIGGAECMLGVWGLRRGGAVPGIYGGFLDKVPFGAAVQNGLTPKTGQTHVHRYLQPLLGRIQEGDIDPRFVISHRLDLEGAPNGYAIFKQNQDDVTKVVLKP